MPHWFIKLAIQRGISLLPRSHKWNELFQKHLTRSLQLTPDRFEERVKFCRTHLEHLRQFGSAKTENFTVLEVGTGWYPVVPIGLFLCGAGNISTYDIAPLLTPERVAQALRMFDDYERRAALKTLLPEILPERMAQLRSVAAAAEHQSAQATLAKLNIHARVQDAQDTGLESVSIDLSVSTGVLEYIPVKPLVNILAEFKRVGRPGSVTSHYLNLIDQYWYFDRSITPFNFLRFTERQWKYFNSPLTWLNRLRISDYRDLLAATGFEVVKETDSLGSEAELARVPLAPEFQKYSKQDLLVLTSWLAGRLTGPRPGEKASN